MDKNHLINKIKEIQGLTNDEKSALLELLNTQKKYGLVWEDKPEDIEEKLREELPVLKEVKERAIISEDKDAPNHILIEGDNLEALASLCYTHEGKIDVIYIDPPYNTGNKDFVYNDTFVDLEDSFRHSKWLSFMNKRLKLAKQLMSEKGVIFISIDDNEAAQLKLLCDDIFNNEMKGWIIWQHSIQPKGYSGTFSIHHNHILCYCKNKLFNLLSLERTDEDNKSYSNPDNDPRGAWRSGDVRNALYRPNLIYDIITPSGNIIKPCPNGWRWSKETIQEKIKTGEIIFSSDESRIIRKIYLDTLNGRTPETLWFGKDVGTTRDATNELKSIFSTSPFDTPKPINLLKRILQISIGKSGVILDFFAGSGTTLHATMELNKDGGNRQCILVTNNENNICEEVTYERNKRVINGYTTPKGVEVEGLQNNNLRYYQTEFIPREQTMTNKRKLVLASTDLLCIKENIYTESKRFGNLKLKPAIARYFENGDNKMLIVYNEEAISYFVNEIDNMELNQPIKVYVFSPGQYAFDDDFFEVADKVTLCALPAAIYAAYKKVLPKRKNSQLEEIAETENTEPSSTLFSEDNMKGE